MAALDAEVETVGAGALAQPLTPRPKLVDRIPRPIAERHDDNQGQTTLWVKDFEDFAGFMLTTEK